MGKSKRFEVAVDEHYFVQVVEQLHIRHAEIVEQDLGGLSDGKQGYFLDVKFPDDVGDGVG